MPITDPDKLREKWARYRRERKELLRQKGREYREVNADRIKAKSPANSRRMTSRYSQLKRRSRARGFDAVMSYQEYTAVLGDGRCHYCGAPGPEVSHGLDRVDNAKGYVASNCVPCCRACNTRKSRLGADEFMIRWNLGKSTHRAAKTIPAWKRGIYESMARRKKQ